jgi:hypothetical protein
MEHIFITIYRVALYIVDQTLPSERGGHYQQLIPQQYTCRSNTQNFMVLFKFSLKNAVLLMNWPIWRCGLKKLILFYVFL